MIYKNVWGYVFELGRGKNYSIKEIADVFDHQIQYEENKSGEAESTLCQDNTAKQLLGWNPKIDVIDYVKFTKNKIG